MNADTYAEQLGKEVYPSFSFRARDIDEAVRWQRAFRAELASLLGLPVIASRGAPPLTARQISVEPQPDHVREEWTLETEPGFHLSFYLLKPLDAGSDPRPLVLTPHGHGKLAKKTYVGIYETEADRLSIVEGERDIALQAVREGYIAIAPDMRGFAGLRLKEDIEKDANNSCQILQLRAYMFGRTLIGDRVWDIQRLIDWASTRPDVDSRRIVITGNSGGGTISVFAAAIDERIGVAVPGSYFCTFKDSILAIRHCACNYVPGLSRRAEMYDVAALIAPRPFLAVSGRQDPIFPIQATQYAYERLKEAYAVFGREEFCALSIGEGGHRYYKKDVWPFVRRALEQLG